MEPKSPFSIKVAGVIARSTGMRPELIEEAYSPQLFSGNTCATFQLQDLVVKFILDRGKIDGLVKVPALDDKKWYAIPYIVGFLQRINDIDDLLDSLPFQEIEWFGENLREVQSLLCDPLCVQSKKELEEYTKVTSQDRSDRRVQSFIARRRQDSKR